MRMNERFFPELERLVSWFYTTYGSTFKRKDGTFRYEVTRNEFVKSFKAIDDLERNGEIYLEVINNNNKYAEDSVIRRVANDYYYSESKRKLLKEVKSTLEKYKDLAENLLDNHYRISLVDAVKMLNLKKDYAADFYKVNMDYIELPSPLRHLLDPKGGNDFYRRQIFININSIESFIEEAYRIEEDNISITLTGNIVEFLCKNLSKRRRVNSIAEDIIKSNEVFHVPDERKKLTKKEIKEIMDVLNLPEDKQDKTKAPRFNFRQIGIHEDVSLLKRKEDLKKEFEINKASKVGNGKYAHATSLQALKDLVNVSHYKIPLEYEINGFRRYIINYIKHPEKNKRFIISIDEENNETFSDFRISEGFRAGGSSITFLLPAAKANEENIRILIKLLKEKIGATC